MNVKQRMLEGLKSDRIDYLYPEDKNLLDKFLEWIKDPSGRRRREKEINAKIACAFYNTGLGNIDARFKSVANVLEVYDDKLNQLNNKITNLSFAISAMQMNREFEEVGFTKVCCEKKPAKKVKKVKK